MNANGTQENSRLALFEKLVYKIAQKWVAGYSMRDALNSARETNAKGLSAIINYLGEHNMDDCVIDASVTEYLLLLKKMDQLHINGSISLKLSQIGLDKDYDRCENNALKIIERAKSLNKFVWLDMESSCYLTDTIRIYLTLLNHYGSVGMAFQAYLKQGINRLTEILMHKSKIRLVKGAYREDRAIVFKSKRVIDKNYLKVMHLLFEVSDNFAIATHDQSIINHALELNDRYHKQFEFQMLKGVRDDIKPILIKKGFSITDYIPYGENVAAYSVRRIKERPSNLLLLARSLF